MFLGLVALYLIGFFVCTVAHSRREGYWSPITVFGITAFYYYLSVPVELYLRGEEVFATYPAVVGITPVGRVQIACCALLALAGFVSGHRMSGLSSLPQRSESISSPKVQRSLAFVAIGAVLLMLLLYRTTIFDKLAYDDANERRYNDPVFGYLTRLCLLAGCLCTGVIIQRRGAARTPALVIAAVAATWRVLQQPRTTAPARS